MYLIFIFTLFFFLNLTINSIIIFIYLIYSYLINFQHYANHEENSILLRKKLYLKKKYTLK